MAASEEAPAEAPERVAFRAEARAFLEAHAEPRTEADPWEVVGFPDDDEALAHFEKCGAWQRTLADNGWAGLTWPTEYGGRGLEAWADRIFARESVRFGSNAGFIRASMAMLGPTLLALGTEEQKLRFLPPMLRADETWCQLFSEPGAGSDLAGLATSAVIDGDEFVVDGQKVWNSSAQFCNRGFLLVRSDPDAPKHRGISFLLIDMTSPGVDVRPLVQANGSAHFNEVFLTGVRVPVANLVGELHGGWGPARMVLGNEASFIGGTGGGRRTSDRLIDLARLFDRQDDPVVRQELVRAYSRERISGLMGRRMRDVIRQGGPPPFDPALMKVFVTDSKVHTGQLATSIAGPAGMACPSDDDRIGRWVQAEVINRYTISIGGGTTEVQKNNLGERSLGLPREPRSDKDIPWRDVPRS